MQFLHLQSGLKSNQKKQSSFRAEERCFSYYFIFLFKMVVPGNSLVVQWLRLYASTAGGRVWSLVGELRSHMPRSVAKKTNKKHRHLPNTPTLFLTGLVLQDGLCFTVHWPSDGWAPSTYNNVWHMVSSQEALVAWILVLLPPRCKTAGMLVTLLASVSSSVKWAEQPLHQHCQRCWG